MADMVGHRYTVAGPDVVGDHGSFLTPCSRTPSGQSPPEAFEFAGQSRNQTGTHKSPMEQAERGAPQWC